MAEKYLPLYRKYRPSNFEEVVGQETIVKTLLNAIKYNRVSHAYLFCGPRGTGKTSIARIFAKTINCMDLKDGKPCNKCPHCIDMNNSAAMDVIEIDAASNRKVEDARNLLESIQFSPVLGKNKIYIIDEVHMLTTDAFNTLLKTLEEPPENLVFILATTEAHKVMETIVSRCQKFDFRRITVKDIVERLKYIAKQEKIKIEDEALEFIARKSAGGLRDSLALLDQSTVLSLENQTITKNDIISLLGEIGDDDLSEMVNVIAAKEPDKMVKLIKKAVDRGNAPNQIIKELISYFRNLMLASTCKTPQIASQLLDISVENCQKLIEQSKLFSIQEIVQIIERLSEQDKLIRTSTNPYVWLDVALLGVTSRENIFAQKTLLDRIDALEEVVFRGNFKAPQTKPSTPVIVEEKIEKPEVKPVITEKPAETIKNKQSEELTEVKKEPEKETVVKEIEPAIENTKPEPQETETKTKTPSSSTSTVSWDNFLNELAKVSTAAHALVKPHAKVINLNEEIIELAFKLDLFVDKINAKHNQIEEVAKTLFGKTPKIVLRKLTDDDFKKKILNDSNEASTSIPSNTLISEKPEQTQDGKDSDSDEISSKEDSVDITTEVSDSEFLPPPIPDDISDNTKNILDVFSGKIVE